MPSYKDLLAQRQALDAQIASARQSELSAAIARVKEMVGEFSLTEQDIFGKPGRTPSATGATTAPKYRDPASGATWTGRGKPPRWIANQDRAKFAL